MHVLLYQLLLMLLFYKGAKKISLNFESYEAYGF